MFFINTHLLKKELYQLFFSPLAWIFTAVFLAVSNFFFFNGFFLNAQASMSSFFALLPLILLFFTASLSMASFSSEKRSGTLEVLLSLPIKKAQIVMSKFLSLFFFFFFVFFFTLTIPVVLFFLGKPDLGAVFAGYLGSLLLSALFLSVGIFISSLFTQQIISFLLTALTLLAFVLIGQDFVFERLPSGLQLLAFVSPSVHFANFAKGVLEAKSLIYFLTLSFLFLYLATYFVGFEKKKLSLKEFILPKVIFGVVLIFGINLAFFFYPIKIDLTGKKTYSLSSATYEIIKNLDDIVNIKIYASGNLPPRFLFLKQTLKDILKEYQSISFGKIKAGWFDPDKDNQILEEAQRLGIPQLQFSSIEKDKFQVTQGFLGLAIFFEDRKETIPFIQQTGNLEYELTSIISKITRKERPKIYFSQGHGENLPQNQNPLGQQKSLLEEIFANEFELGYQTISSDSAQLVPEDASALILIGPKETFSFEDKFVLDQALMKGTSFLALVEGVEVGENLSVTPAKHALFDWLEHFGVTLEKNLVLDVSNEIANFSAGLTTFLTPYPFWVKTIDEGINQNHQALNGIQALIFPWVSALKTASEKEGITPLIYSTNQAWSIDKNFSLSPTQKFKPENQERKLLAVEISGKMKSFFADRKIPKIFANKEFLKEGEKGKLILVGDSDFAREELAARFEPNLVFFVNLIEYLASDTKLSQIRIKGEDIRPLREIPDNTRETIKYGNILGMPLLVGFLGFGFLYWQGKRKYQRE